MGPRLLLLMLGALAGGGAGIFSPPATNAQAANPASTLLRVALVKPRSQVWIPISEVVGMVLTLTLVISLWVRFGVRQGRTVNVPAEEPILDTAIEDEVPPPITFRCPACKKRLKVRADLVGKKVRCAQCGQPVRVPDHTIGEAGGRRGVDG